jgi:hypothetical protein
MTKPELRDIGLHGISVLPNRLRVLRIDKINQLAGAMTLAGQISPIGVRRRGGPGGTGFVLIYGRHRYEAARKLKWPSIRCEIWEEIDVAHAELWELDENLMRAELSPAEQALHYGRRKVLYEQIHPETRPTKQGGPGRRKKRTQSQPATELAPAFIDDAAEKMGKHRATVAREIARANNVVVLADVVDTSLDQKFELDAPTAAIASSK